MIVVKIDAVNVILKSVNTVSSIYIYIYIYIFFFTFLHPIGVHSVTGMSTKMILSYCQVSCSPARQKPYFTAVSLLDVAAACIF